jgi:hypothetical protein
MPTLFRSLLFLYPNAYRSKFEEEMLSVLTDRRADLDDRVFPRMLFVAHESTGLLLGAFREHVRNVYLSQDFDIPQRRRLTMRSDFRFPKSTVTLMLVILAAVVYTIEEAKSLQHVLPSSSPALGHVEHPAHVAVIPAFFAALAVVLSCAALGWIILFAFRRSGLHRLSNLDTSVGHHHKTTLTQ